MFGKKVEDNLMALLTSIETRLATLEGKHMQLGYSAGGTAGKQELRIKALEDKLRDKVGPNQASYEQKIGALEANLTRMNAKLFSMNYSTGPEDDHKLLMAVRLGHVRSERSWRDRNVYDYWVGDINVTNLIMWLYRSDYLIHASHGTLAVNEDLVHE